MVRRGSETLAADNISLSYFNSSFSKDREREQNATVEEAYDLQGQTGPKSNELANRTRFAQQRVINKDVALKSAMLQEYYMMQNYGHFEGENNKYKIYGAEQSIQHSEPAKPISLSTSAQQTQEFSNKLEDTTVEAPDDIDAATTDNLNLNNTSDLAPFMAAD